MRTKGIPVSILAMLLLSTGLLWADCTDFSRATSWSVEGDQKIVFSRGPARFAELSLQDCKVYPNSNVQLTKSYMCDSDTIIVDGQECNLLSLRSLD